VADWIRIGREGFRFVLEGFEGLKGGEDQRQWPPKLRQESLERSKFGDRTSSQDHSISL
jgi:hypothetical protein